MLIKSVHPNIVSSPFVKHPIVILVTEFNEKSLEVFTKDFIEAESSGQEIIPIQIDSYGGQVHALMGMLSVVERSSRPVCTFTTTKACSCGSSLLAAGTKGFRYSAQIADIMVHDMSAVAYGKTEDVVSKSTFIAKLAERLFSILDKNCGKEKGYFRKKMREGGNVDMWYSAQQAKREGLVDKIGTPKFEIEVTQKFKIV